MCRKAEVKAEASKRIVASLMLVSYIFVISPVALFAEEGKK